MIKARELRIGNYIMRGGKEMVAHKHTVADCDLLPHYYKPILITESLLIDLGFVKANDMDCWYKIRILNDWTFLFINPKHKMAEISISRHGCVLKFNGTLHELQNLHHSLTREELTLSKPTK